MIHELLIGTNPKARSILTWNMLIGGPNQSHKVNFKELPFEGKSFSKDFGFLSVNRFFRTSATSENWRKRTERLPPLTASALFLARLQSKGRETVQLGADSASLFSKISEKI